MKTEHYIKMITELAKENDMRLIEACAILLISGASKSKLKRYEVQLDDVTLDDQLTGNWSVKVYKRTSKIK